MQYTYESVTGEEFDRQKAVYQPFTDAVRDLLDAAIRTEVDADVVRDVQQTIENATARLREKQIDGAYGVRFASDGRGQAWGNPVIGVRNAFAPPLHIVKPEPGRCSTDFTLGAAYEGPSGHVHGGVSALILDHVLGEAAAHDDRPNFTGTITLRYVRATPLGRLRADAAIERVDGVKTIVRGAISDDSGVTVEAEGVFIRPAWAR